MRNSLTTTHYREPQLREEACLKLAMALFLVTSSLFREIKQSLFPSDLRTSRLRANECGDSIPRPSAPRTSSKWPLLGLEKATSDPYTLSWLHTYTATRQDQCHWLLLVPLDAQKRAEAASFSVSAPPPVPVQKVAVGGS